MFTPQLVGYIYSILHNESLKAAWAVFESGAQTEESFFNEHTPSHSQGMHSKSGTHHKEDVKAPANKGLERKSLKAAWAVFEKAVPIVKNLTEHTPSHSQGMHSKSGNHRKEDVKAPANKTLELPGNCSCWIRPNRDRHINREITAHKISSTSQTLKKTNY
jgi:hypothetical protein